LFVAQRLIVVDDRNSCRHHHPLVLGASIPTAEMTTPVTVRFR
jgi:hypothetical protein